MGLKKIEGMMLWIMSGTLNLHLYVLTFTAMLTRSEDRENIWHIFLAIDFVDIPSRAHTFKRTVKPLNIVVIKQVIGQWL